VIKLLMGWNIVPGHESEYFDFIVQEFEPGLAELGLQTTDVWYTTYGNWPQIITGTVSGDLATMRRALLSGQWHSLKSRLLQHVTGYQQKIIRASGRYQL